MKKFELFFEVLWNYRFWIIERETLCNWSILRDEKMTTRMQEKQKQEIIEGNNNSVHDCLNN